jgi:membrane-bound metal-dependent hydrolase YbcI (DUF457 family)
MLLWFIGGAIAIVWYVFHDGTIDYRYLVTGALLPDAVDLVIRHLATHSLIAPVLALVVVMLATYGRKPIRKKLLMVPIGMFLHLVLDAAFTRTNVFWWPLSGGRVSSNSIPSLTRGWIWAVALEAAGLVLLVLAWRPIQESRGELPKTNHEE